MDNEKQATVEETTEPVDGKTTEEQETSEEKTPEEAKADQEEKKKNHNARRWEKLVREHGRALGEAAELRRQLEERDKAGIHQTGPMNTRPSREQYQDDASYFDALVDWKVDQKIALTKAELQQQQERITNNSGWAQSEKVAREKYADYDDVVRGATDVLLPQVCQDAILGSPVGADIFYHLAQNPEEAEAINGMSPVRAIAAIGKIEAKLESAEKKPPVKTSRAPEPIASVGSRGSAETNPDKLATVDWMKKTHPELFKKKPK